MGERKLVPHPGILWEARRSRVPDARDPVPGKITNGGFGDRRRIPHGIDQFRGDQVLVTKVFSDPAYQLFCILAGTRGLTPFVNCLDRVIVGLAVILGGSGGLGRRRRCTSRLG